MGYLRAIAVLVLFSLVMSVGPYVLQTGKVNAATLRVHFNDEFEAGSLASSWKWINPSGDCSYSLTDNYGYLRIYVLGGDHDLGTRWENQNAPRILQDWSGDFILETKLAFTYTSSVHSAGILLWSNSSSFILFERGYAAAFSDRFIRARVASTARTYGGWAEIGNSPFEDDVVYLKVERRAKLFTFSYSNNDSTWNELASESVPLGKLLSVGLFVLVQESDNPLYVDFDFLRISKMLSPPPKNLQATSGSRLITLSWVPPINNEGAPITNYGIYRGVSTNSETYFTTVGNVTTYTDINADRAQEYFYKVNAISSSGESDLSNEASAMPNLLPLREQSGSLAMILVLVSIAAAASSIPVVTHRKSFTRRNLSTWFNERKKDIAIVLGWTLAVTLILVRTYLVFYIRNPYLRGRMVPLDNYAGPMFELLDLFLLFVVSAVAGVLLFDMERIFYGYFVSMLSSFIISIAFAALYIWYVLGWEQFSQIAFIWEYIIFWSLSNMFRAMFPLPILLAFVAAFFGALIRNWIKP